MTMNRVGRSSDYDLEIEYRYLEQPDAWLWYATADSGIQVKDALVEVDRLNERYADYPANAGKAEFRLVGVRTEVTREVLK